MKELLAKLRYRPNNFEIIEEGNYVICAVSGKKIVLEHLSYWNVELQEAYYSSKEANLKYEKIKKDKVI
tara:strand:- start:267 stop:473 length:207 start_codon:yes stop_codon:yes gene_type:complete